jgi:hypothetical protein
LKHEDLPLIKLHEDPPERDHILRTGYGNQKVSLSLGCRGRAENCLHLEGDIWEAVYFKVPGVSRGFSGMTSLFTCGRKHLFGLSKWREKV